MWKKRTLNSLDLIGGEHNNFNFALIKHLILTSIDNLSLHFDFEFFTYIY
jgi:UDP-N-acetylglucosamine pyrophosphorylase